MTNEDQIATLFAEANPVPSLDVFDALEPLDIDRLGDRSERSSRVISTKPDERKAPGRWPRLAIGLAMSVIAVVAVAILNNRDRGNEVGYVPTTTPTATTTGTTVAQSEAVVIVDAYLDALDEFDVAAMRELVNPNSEVDTGFRELREWQQAAGYVISYEHCAEVSSGPTGTLVECPWTMTTPVFEALRLEPGQGLRQYLVRDGKIQDENELLMIEDDNVERAWTTFRVWVERNYPGDYSMMFDTVNGGAHMDAESNALWEQYTEEFVAAFEG